MSEAAGEGRRLQVGIITLFPEMVRGAASHSILGRAQAAGLLELRLIDPREFTTDRHRSVDDYPFGGGAGMVMKPEPLAAAIEAAWAGERETPVFLLAPDGEPLTQAVAKELAQRPRFVLVCGHYEGVDERVREIFTTRTLSIGDYVLTGGELAALVVLDATVRLLPGALGNAESAGDESFAEGLLEYPQYTRPALFRGHAVPEVLLSGHHARIARWRRQQALARTRTRRPDLWERLGPLSKADQRLLDEYDRQQAEASAFARTAEAAADAGVHEPVSQPNEVSVKTAGGGAETKSMTEGV